MRPFLETEFAGSLVPSLKKNVLFNYIGQFYSAFIGILILPFYLQELGAEAFGVIGFFTLLLAWLQLLDLGMTPTLGREIARLKGDVANALELRTVVRTLEIVFIWIAIAAGFSLFFAKDWIVRSWFRVENLDLELVSSCVGIMAVMVGFRWLTAFYRSGVLSFEQQVWVSLVDTAVVTMRFPVALIVIVASEGNILFYFSFQLVLSVVECAIYSVKLSSALPSTEYLYGFDKGTLCRVAPFALGIGYTAGIWVFVTQLDKLLLSEILPLAEYGYFTLIASLSGGIMFLSGPVGRAVLPRMTALLSAGKEDEMLAIYMNATRLVAAVVTPIVLLISFYPRGVVYFWTGNADASLWVADILPLYIIGYGLLTVGAFQYYLQYAHGRLKQHVVYNTVSALVSIPAIFYSAHAYGPIGVASVWVIFRAISFFFWSPYVHHLFAPGIHKEWVLKCVFPPVVVCFIVLFVTERCFDYNFMQDRWGDFFFLSMLSIMLIIMSFLSVFYKEIGGFARDRF